MICQRVTTENLIERYLDGTLDPELRDEFERHYFDCEDCFTQLQTAQSIKPVLATLPTPIAAKRSNPFLPWIGVAAAATVAFLFFSWPNPTTSAPPVVASAPPAAVSAPLQLSEIQPAPYAPTLFRDGAANPGPAFEAAMRLYQKRQWQAAAQSLAPLAQSPTPNPAALHFAGISHLLAGQTEAALAPLDRVIALGAKSPFEEEARFYRAQALLLAARLPEARQELQRVVKWQGDYEAQARALLKRL